MALLEARPYRPFKSSEEYLEAMKEDLAEWLSTMYPELMINAENFMDRLDTGVALCKHANYVRQAAEDYLARRQARNKSMTRSMTSGLAGPILAMGTVHYLPAAKSGTFFARDNVSNFITWCRKSLKIIECLLFETDDLIMRKNEKHVILCLLEVARRGAKFGMLAPMLVQMERQIDREIAADNKANGIGCGTQTDGADGHSNNSGKSDVGVGTGDDANALNGGCGIGVGVGVGGDGGGDDEDDDDDMFDSDSENGDGDDDGPMLVYGPQPQIITNDLKSLDEMVRDLVEKCTCPSQFPMVRVSEGKYRIGDTKVLIFVRILRSHVMVRVGGGWDTLAHYLDKHDPCRCRAQHRASVAARLVPRAGPQTNGIELHKAQVIFERSPPAARKAVSAFNGSASPSHASPATAAVAPSTPPSASGGLSPTTYGGPKTRSRSPTPQRKFLSQLNADVAAGAGAGTERSLLPAPSSTLASPGLARRSMSPSPRRLIDMRKKQASLDSACGPKSLPLEAGAFDSLDGGVAGSSSTASVGAGNGSGLGLGIGLDPSTNGSNKFENISDNGSEISDEGYRSLGVIQSSGGAQKRESLHSQASMEDAESNARLDPTSSSDSQLSPADDSALSTNTTTTTTTTTKTPDNTLDTNLEHALDNNLELTLDNNLEHALDADDYNEAGPQSLPAVLFAAAATTRTPPSTPTGSGNRFEQSGIFITDDEITVDVALTNPKTNLGRGRRDVDERSTPQSRKATNEGATKIPRTPLATTAIGTATRTRRRSLDNSGSGCSGSLQDLPSRTGLPVFSRKKPVYRSVRRPHEPAQDRVDAMASIASMAPTASPRRSPAPHSGVATPPVRDVTNTWSGRTAASGKKQRPTIGADTFAPPTAGVAAFERNSKTRSSQVLYDSNGRRVRGGAGSGSLTTSPVKSQATSPLAQQLLEAASSAKNDAQILEKMKTLLSRYATTNATTSAPKASPNPAATATAMSKKPVYEDFTTAWVHSNGTLERSSSCSPPTKARSKRSSAASSVDSTHSRDNLGGAPSVVSPRRERGLSRIPGPIRQHTELY